MTKKMTLSELIAETYTKYETAYYVFCDRGNGSGFGELGIVVKYEDNDAGAYGNIDLSPLGTPILSDDRVECSWASDWIVGENGYEFRIMF